MHLRKLLGLAAFGLLLVCGSPALADLDTGPADLVVVAAPATIDCAAPAADAVAVETLFIQVKDLALCEPDLLAATDLCLSPVRFDNQDGRGVIIGLRHLADCPPQIRSPPG